jgi:hypothetical protein
MKTHDITVDTRRISVVNSALPVLQFKVKQMIKPDAPASERINFGSLTEASFFRRRHGAGEIFFAGESPDSNEFAAWPVLENGLISKCASASDLPHDKEEVDIINPEELGITKIKWADDS